MSPGAFVRCVRYNEVRVTSKRNRTRTTCAKRQQKAFSAGGAKEMQRNNGSRVWQRQKRNET